MRISLLDGVATNTWYESDEGSDMNVCNSLASPCRHLQSVLNKACDGADIIITSSTLNLNPKEKERCQIESQKSFRIISMHNVNISVICADGQ